MTVSKRRLAWRGRWALGSRSTGGATAMTNRRSRLTSARSFRRITGAPVVVVIAMTLATWNSIRTRTAARRIPHGGAEHRHGCAELMLAADAEGLASCWMCAPLFCPGVVRSALGMPGALAASRARSCWASPPRADAISPRRPLGDFVDVARPGRRPRQPRDDDVDPPRVCTRRRRRRRQARGRVGAASSGDAADRASSTPATISSISACTFRPTSTP